MFVFELGLVKSCSGCPYPPSIQAKARSIAVTNTADVVLEFETSQVLGEEVRLLISGRDILDGDDVCANLLIDEVMRYVNVLAAAGRNVGMGHRAGPLIVGT
jgi:hypothetical protein